MTKEEFLEAWEGACVEAAVDEWEKARNGDPFQSLATKYCSNRGVQEALIRGAYRAIGSKLMEGLQAADREQPGSPVGVRYWLTLPKEQ